jgi:hypothetical protein
MTMMDEWMTACSIGWFQTACVHPPLPLAISSADFVLLATQPLWSFRSTTSRLQRIVS